MKIKMESFEEAEPNGGEHSRVSSREGLITYKRKRSRPTTLGTGDNASGLAEEKVLCRSKRKRKSKDIGWEHGVMIDGNRFHWQCKWCGVSRNSGGVSRLKKHIAGAGDTIKCMKVPGNIAKAMKEHLLDKGMLNKQTRFRQNGDNRKSLGFSLSGDSGDENPSPSELHMQARSDTQQFCRATQRSVTENMQLEVSIHKTMDIPHETVLPAGTHHKIDSSKVDQHWRNILEDMLQCRGVNAGGVIRSCIQDALASSSSRSDRNFKMNDVKDFTSQRKDESESRRGAQGQCQSLEKFGAALMEVMETSTQYLHTHIQTMKCSNVFREILLSEKFALLCDLLKENFQEVKLNSIFDLSLINSRMENGYYEQFPESFDQDIQLVWREFQKIGDKMVSLASGLSSISQTLYEKQVGEGLAYENAEQKCEVSNQVVQQNNTIDSHGIASEFPCESYHSAKPDQTETSYLVTASTSKQCDTEADGKKCVTFNGCEPISHFSPRELAADAVPVRGWHCAPCSTNRCFTHQQAKTSTEEDNLHGECEVCRRLEVPGALELIDSSRESAEFDESRERPIQVPMAAISRVCKQCGTCENDDRRFLVCGNPLCPYKFYHIRCLKGNRVAIQKQSLHCWYCPSCLCRVCLSDKDDDMIVMCDGCDEAYHTYCMRPPCTAIRSGKWYCEACNVMRARQGMRRYEQRILWHHAKSDVRKATGANKSMDMLLRAAEKLSSEESLAAGKEDQ